MLIQCVNLCESGGQNGSARVGPRTFALLAVAAAAAIASCGQPTPSTSTGTDLLPMTPRFVGRWAVDPSLCEFGAWEFTSSGVSTAGEVSCSFSQVTPVGGGYDISAVCLAEGVSSTSTIRLRFPESADGMLVDGGPWQPIGLSECGPAPILPGGMPPP